LRRAWACQARSASPLARAYVCALLPCVTPNPPKERRDASAGFRCTVIF
jgi:hypothetical protein